MKIHEKFERTLTNILAEAYQKLPKVGSRRLLEMAVWDVLGALGRGPGRSWAGLGARADS